MGKAGRGTREDILVHRKSSGLRARGTREHAFFDQNSLLRTIVASKNITEMVLTGW